MNTHNMQKLAAHLRELPTTTCPLGFNMHVLCSHLGRAETVGCIAGHAAFLAKGNIQFYFAKIIATDWLNLSPDQADCLFNPPEEEFPIYDATPSEAADQLDAMLAGQEPWGDYKIIED